jgi:two-component system nitrate/nitrite response regulator NarL
VPLRPLPHATRALAPVFVRRSGILMTPRRGARRDGDKSQRHRRLVEPPSRNAWESSIENRNVTCLPAPPMRVAARRIRLLIADDETLFREALRLLLETEPDFHVIGYASDGVEAVALARRLKPDVLLLDLAMPRLPGLEALRSITAGSIRVRTILVTGSMTRTDVLTALQYGAQGIVMKDVPPDVLFKSIHAVMNGQYWIQREAVSDLIAAVRESRAAMPPQPPVRRFNLTPRELEIIRAVLDGHGNKEIASRLGVTEPTVKHHLTSIFDKVGVSNRLELALFALHHGLV